MNTKKRVIIGIPCFNEESNVFVIYDKIKKIIAGLNNYQFFFLFVDNGSNDETRKKIKELIKRDKSVRGVFLSRNFGPENSGQAVMDFAGDVDALITLPCDFQDPPELIPKFLKKWESGCDIVVGVYTNSDDGWFTAFVRKSFYGVFKRISNIDVPVNASGVGLLNKKALKAIDLLPEKYRFFRGLRSWVGFKTEFVKYKRNKRLYGKSSYRSFFDYFKHAERGIFGFSYLPLDLIVYFGFILTILSFLFIVGYLFTVFVFGNPIKASITLMLAVVFFGGINLLALSIIGKYIQVIVEETKNRPIYIVDEKLNFKS